MCNKRKIAEKVFMIIILVLFAAFLFLWLKTDEAVLRYAVGALLLAVAIVFKIVDKKLAETEKDKEKEDPVEKNEG